MTFRNVLIIAASLAGLLFALGVSCDSSGRCGPASCAEGCCAEDDTCQGGDFVGACGAAGERCAVCGDAEGCELGRCVPLGTEQSPGGAADAAGGGGGGAGSRDAGRPEWITDAGLSCLAQQMCPRRYRDDCGEPCPFGCCFPNDALGRCSTSPLSSLCGERGALCEACTSAELCVPTSTGSSCVPSGGGGGGGGAGGAAGGGGGGDGGLPIGAPCTAASECAGGVCELGDGFLEGYCSARCTGAGDCPSGSSCSPFFGSSPDPQCMADCPAGGDGQSTCRTGYICDLGWVTASTQANCAPACATVQDCGGARCERGYCCGAINLKCCASAPGCAAGSSCASDGYCE